MSCKKKIGSSGTQVCIGSLGTRILIQKRKEQFLNTGKVYNFETVYEIWSNVETRNGERRFSSININDNPSHIFTIRKISGLTSEYWVSYNSNRFRIIEIETVNEDKYQRLFCRVTGSDAKEGSKS